SFLKLLQMRKFILSAAFLVIMPYVFAQTSKVKKTKALNLNEVKISMQPAYWEYDTSAAEFVNYKNTEAIRGKNGKSFQVFLKNRVFTNGTIEFDVELS